MTIREFIKQVFGANRPPVAPQPTTPTQPPPPVPATPGDIAASLLAAHNAFRAARGRGPFARSPQLEAAAQVHANLMAARGRMSHQLFGEHDPFKRIEDAGYRYGLAGENVAGDYPDVPSVMIAWENDLPHRANIMGSFVHMGGAMAVDASGKKYWSVSFASPLGQAAAPPSGVANGLAPAIGADGTISAVTSR